MGETKPKKMVSRSVAIALVIVCVLLIAGLGGAMAYYATAINDKDSRINSANNTINQLNATIVDQIGTITSLNANIANSTTENNLLQTWLDGNETLLNQTETWLQNNITDFTTENNLLQTWLDGNEKLANQTETWLVDNTYYNFQIANPFLQYDYLVACQGSNFVAKNGTTGQIDLSSTDASTVLQYTFENGYNIEISPGTYNLTKTVFPRSNSTITGDGPISLLNMSDNTLSTPIMTLNNTNNVKIYSLGFNHNIYEILGSTAKVADDMDLYCANCSNIDIGGCYFTGSGDYCVAIGANQTNVNSHPEAVQPCYGAYYHGNFMNNTRSDGLDIMGGSGFVIEGNIFNNTGDDAIAYHGFGSHPVADIDVFANVIDNCNTNAMKFSNDGYQTILPDEMTDINIHGNIIDTTTNAGLMIKVTTLWGAVAPCAGVSFVSNMTFSDNIVRNTSQEGIVAEYSQTGALLPNFAITGNVFDHCGQNTNGLDFYGLTYSTVASNTFDNCASSGTTVIDMKNCSGNTITGNTICYSKLYGIVDDTGSGRNVFSNNLIANTAGTGIWLNTVAYDLCTSNYIVNAGVGGTGDGIQEWGSYDTIMMNKIYNCSRYRIYVHSGSSYADIEENDVRNGGSSTANGIKVLGTSCTVRRNIGWVTENSGSQANCVSGTTIVHGLAGTPNGQINAITNVTGEIVSITAVGSTTFTLGIMWWNGTTVDSSHSPCTIYWSAQYLP